MVSSGPSLTHTYFSIFGAWHDDPNCVCSMSMPFNENCHYNIQNKALKKWDGK